MSVQILTRSGAAPAARPAARPAPPATRRARPSAPAVPAARAARAPFRVRWNRLRNQMVLSRQLQVLLSAGTPVVEALSGVERQMKDAAWREAVGDVRARIEGGAALAEAMDAHPALFDPVFRSLIRAGEASGKLPEILGRLVDLCGRDLSTRSGVLGALLYPALLLVIVVVVSCMTLIFVVPRFGAMFETLGSPIPASTRATLALSAALTTWWWAVLIGAAAAAVLLSTWSRAAAGRRAGHTLVLRLPVIGGIARAFATARVVRLLGTLTQSHLPLLEVLDLVETSCGNLHYAALVREARENVSRGEPVSAAFDKPDLIAVSVYEAFRSGEASGRIGPSLVTVATFLEEENDVLVRSLTKVLEPLILVVLGGLVGLLAVSMFLPLFDLAANAGGAP